MFNNIIANETGCIDVIEVFFIRIEKESNKEDKVRFIF
jgi:hypothetical protein